MNDKIRELLKESGFCFWADEEWGPGAGKIDWNCDYEKEFDRFVELIVEECAEVAIDWDGAHYDVGTAIKKHFEVEDKADEFENWCRESDDGGEERESNSRFHNFAEGICESYQAGILDAIDAQIDANPELITPADEEQLDRLDELLVNVECKTHPDAPHGFSRNASHNADRYVCECEHWEEPK